MSMLAKHLAYEEKIEEFDSKEASFIFELKSESEKNIEIISVHTKIGSKVNMLFFNHFLNKTQQMLLKFKEEGNPKM